ncbi:MAG: PEP-CTERM sorting domain-containing protein [Thermodesulfobacteriota bacterium]
MKRQLSTTMFFCFLFAFSVNAFGAPFPVSPVPKETGWTGWGYVVDGQTWGNWFAVNIPYGTEASMSGNYVIQEDFLFQVDPATSGLADPNSVYGQNFWNHDNVYGLGEFFDAGLGTNDRNYYLKLTLGATDTWEVWYDADRDLINDGGSEHAILAGTVSQYWNRDGYFYGVLVDDDGKYNGDFSPSHTEGTPDLVFTNFHAGKNEPVPEPATMLLLGSGLAALAGFRRKFRSRRR